jgi:hypothetical protein
MLREKKQLKHRRNSSGVSAKLKEPAGRLTLRHTGTLRANRLIADFMTASNRVEQYLHKKGPLTDLQYESITTTVDGLRTFLQTWKTHFRSKTP